MQKSYIPSPLRQQRPSSGFTLIELLVVVAIIAILASILFPVFGRARENARRSSCASNLKQIGISVMQYSQDYDEFYPPAFNGNIDPTPAVGTCRPWSFIMQPYIRNIQILQCPSESQLPGTSAGMRFWRTQLSGMDVPVHYAYNYNLGGTPEFNVGTSMGNKKLTQVVRPAEVVMMADAGTRPPWADTASSTVPDDAPPADWQKVKYLETAGDASSAYGAWLLTYAKSEHVNEDLPFGTVAARHLNTTNVLWADGHVKAMQPAQIMSLTPGLDTINSPDWINKPSSCFNPGRGCNNVLNG